MGSETGGMMTRSPLADAGDIGAGVEIVAVGVGCPGPSRPFLSSTMVGRAWSGFAHAHASPLLLLLARSGLPVGILRRCLRGRFSVYPRRVYVLTRACIQREFQRWDDKQWVYTHECVTLAASSTVLSTPGISELSPVLGPHDEFRQELSQLN